MFCGMAKVWIQLDTVAVTSDEANIEKVWEIELLSINVKIKNLFTKKFG